MAEVRRIEVRSLWPGFDPATIPAAVFDGSRTFLFGFPGLPRGFNRLAGRPEAAVFEGSHRSVFGNRRTKIDGCWVASVIPVRRSQTTGRLLTLPEMAGVIIHEKFHVFQALRHPDWDPNDGVLLTYPLDTEASYAVRGLEVEAMRRAVTALSNEAAADWARKALVIRRGRLAALPPHYGEYERKLQRFEGLAEYVEYKAGRRPVEDGHRLSGFAPRAIREMGYFEGRWIAELLDRLAPGWPAEVESGAVESLEDRLAQSLGNGIGLADFSSEELTRRTEEARAAVRAKDEERALSLRTFEGKLGTKVIIEAGADPLRFRMFDPFTLEALGPRTMLHSQWVLLRSERGAVEVVGMPVLTELDGRGRVIRMVIPGISNRPKLGSWKGDIAFRQDGLTASFRGAHARTQGRDTLVIRLD
jgi:hypothetical protein